MDDYLIGVLSNIGVISFLALSAYLLLLTGEISFGQQAFFAIGGYAAGIATALWGWPLTAALVWGAATGGAAAVLVGVPTLRLFTRYILPAVSSPILVQASFIFSAAVLGEAGLSFIGVGIGPKELSWGNALTEARNYIAQAPWIVLFPGLALMLTILALNLLGDSLRDILDPRLARRR